MRNVLPSSPATRTARFGGTSGLESGTSSNPGRVAGIPPTSMDGGRDVEAEKATARLQVRRRLVRPRYRRCVRIRHPHTLSRMRTEPPKGWIAECSNEVCADSEGPLRRGACPRTGPTPLVGFLWRDGRHHHSRFERLGWKIGNAAQPKGLNERLRWQVAVLNDVVKDHPRRCEYTVVLSCDADLTVSNVDLSPTDVYTVIRWFPLDPHGADLSVW